MFAGVAIWTEFPNRTRQFAIRIMFALVCAIAANVFRVVGIAAFRQAFYPAWEGQPLHVLFGYLSMLPFLSLLTWRTDLRQRCQWGEVAYVASVLALLSTVVEEPGGVIACLCTLASLIPLAIPQHRQTQTSIRGTLLWLLAAVPISLAAAESLWLPWLLVCPLFSDGRPIWRPDKLLTLTGTIPLIALHPVGGVVVLLASLVRIVTSLQITRFTPQHNATEADDHHPTVDQEDRWWLNAIVMPALLLPFAFPVIMGVNFVREAPPRRIMAKPTGSDGYRIRIPGQPRDMAIFWYGKNRQGRHHSARTCLRFRGVITERAQPQSDTLIGNRMWIREYFILEDKLISSYSSYVLQCFPPFTPQGIHVVIQSPVDSVDYQYFVRESDRLMQQIHSIYQNENS